MVWRGADEGGMIPGEVNSLFGFIHQQNNILFNLPPPPRSALLAEIALEQTVGFQPHVGIPVAVQARFILAFLVFAGQQIPNLDGQRKHPGIVEAGIFGMLF
jgi:hypothetical protein